MTPARVRYRKSLVAGGLLVAVIVWLSSMLPGMIWRGQVYERCDAALGDRFGREIGDLDRDFETIGASWRLTTRWHCKYRFQDTGEVVHVSVSGW